MAACKGCGSCGGKFALIVKNGNFMACSGFVLCAAVWHFGLAWLKACIQRLQPLRCAYVGPAALVKAACYAACLYGGA